MEFGLGDESVVTQSEELESSEPGLPAEIGSGGGPVGAAAGPTGAGESEDGTPLAAATGVVTPFVDDETVPAGGASDGDTIGDGGRVSFDELL